MSVDPIRRELRFISLGEVLADATSLQQTGYEAAGHWDLAQICEHVAQWMDFALDGFPPAPMPLRLVFAVVRNTVGPWGLRQTLARGRMPQNATTLKQTVPPPTLDPSQAIDHLRRTIARFEQHTGPIHPSIIFGPMSREQWTQLTLVHSAHHLGFLRPKLPVVVG